MSCIICDTSLVHLFFEPMNMGCQCVDRVCQRCHRCGDVRRCPQCRKHRKTPTVDRGWLRATWRQLAVAACLGCNRDIAARHLHKHEKRCVKYRAMIDAAFEEDLRMRRVQAEDHRRRITELEDRVDLQEDLIDDLDDRVDGLREENRALTAEHARVQHTLDTVLQPFFVGVRSLEGIYSQVFMARQGLRGLRRANSMTGAVAAITGRPAGPPRAPQSRAPLPPSPPPMNPVEEGEIPENDDEGTTDGHAAPQARA